MNTKRAVDFIRVTSAITILLSAIGFGPVSGATFTVTNTNDSGGGSFRQAITSANLTAAVSDVIHFSIAGAGPHTISPVTPLPFLTSPVVIDGYSQTGASSNTLANGNDAVLQIVVLERLVIDTTNSTVRGLAIRKIDVGAVAGPKGNNLIEGCFVGLDATGTNSLNATLTTVFVQTPNNRIGGTNAGARNVISGSGAVGLEVFEIFATNNVIQGNFIGTDRSGTMAIGNTDRALAVNLNAARTTIGGTAPGARNVISGNLNRGITLDGSNNIVQGNFIGTDVTGLLPLGNARSGVEIGGAGNLVGGTNNGAGNIIAFNGVDGGGVTTNGVDVKPGTTSYAILGNSIFDNAGLGIDVNADKLITAGYPLITLASNTSTATVIRGSNTPNATFRLELFSNPNADPSGFGEGKNLLVSTNVTTDAGGNFSLNLPPITPGLYITATANGTSEFSPVRAITAAGRTNSWTSSLSGKWETAANWSLNFAPFLGQSLVLITNAGTKTVINDGTTASGFPSTLTISNLFISAPGGATNTLLLAHDSMSTPLRIFNNLTVSNGGAIVISNSALILEKSGSRIDGAVTLNYGSLAATNNGQLYIGSSGTSGLLTVSNGTFEAYYPIVGINPNSSGTWHIAGGTNIVTQVFDIGDSLTATGTVKMTGGELFIPNVYVGLFGTGNLIVSNGNFGCDGQVLLGSQPGSQGNFIAAGGYGVIRSLVVSESPSATGTALITDTADFTVFDVMDTRSGGTVRIEGGMLSVANLLVRGTAQFILNRGTLRTVSATISNNVPFVVGDGTNAAAYLFLGDTNSFSRGLRIAPNAILGGGGIIIGNVTNSGLISAGISNFPFSLELNIRGNLVLSNSSELNFGLGYGDFADMDNDFLRTTGSVVLRGKLSARLIQDYQFVMTNGASFTVMSNTTPFTGSFSNVASGGQLTTDDGYAQFTVLYAGSNTVRLTNLQSVDSDGDTMPNWWEDYYGLNKNDPADAGLDSDEDGASNINEFLAGTEPDRFFSVFSIISFQRETNNVRITWNTAPGKSYRVQTNAVASNGSLTTNFVDLSPTIAGHPYNETTTNYVHVGGFTNLPARYYRVRLVP